MPISTPTVSQVLWRVLILNLIVTVSKISVGLATGTIAIVADGIHSAVDSASNVVGLIAGRIASKPPDHDHPYGHDRYETVGAFIIGVFLLLTAWEVFQVAIERLFSNSHPTVSVIQFIVLISTLIINAGVATYEQRMATKLNSELLAADAKHTTSDIWVTISVLFSLVAVQLGLSWMDAFAALLIVGFIVYIAWGILLRAIPVLVDAAPIEATAIEDALSETPGIQRVVQARSRGGEHAMQIDVEIEVAPVIDADSAQVIVENVRSRLSDVFDNINEVRVQLSSQQTNAASDFIAARRIADALGLGVHEIVSVNSANGRLLEMHVEVQPGITLQEAHDQINALEAALLQQKRAIEVITHIEPAATTESLSIPSGDDIDLLSAIYTHLAQHFPSGHWHHGQLRRNLNNCTFTTHCHLPGDISIETAHRFAEDVELSLRTTFRQLHRVIIHTEPPQA